ncbi:MAG: FAD-dependent oxidoreductase, partial [Gemmatimonadetes bacterium]|nr:FAD-dependent oxidoreductase [Gemmatimonadota bacterium]
MEKVDFLVIGSGPAGQKAAIQAAKLGKKTVLVERRTPVGGVSVNTGTIPSKTLREAVLYLTGWRQRSFYGRGYRLKNGVTFQDLTERLSITIRHETEIIRDQLVRNGVEVCDGHGSFTTPNEVAVQKSNGDVCHIHAERILLATGTVPNRPPGIAFDNHRIIDSDGLLALKTLPRTLTVVGAGVIGVEYA